MKHYFKPYQNNSIFIETGTSGGDGVIAAMNADFSIIHSIELSPYYYEACMILFSKEKRVKLHLGDSREILPRILRKINERCTFWLDAHYCGGDAGGTLDYIVLMDELKIIANHQIKEHTILIDDMRLVRNKQAEWSSFIYSQQDIEEFIHTINPNYKITYEFGIVDEDILVAQI
jgi:hypothetical protein